MGTYKKGDKLVLINKIPPTTIKYVVFETDSYQPPLYWFKEVNKDYQFAIYTGNVPKKVEIRFATPSEIVLYF